MKDLSVAPLDTNGLWDVTWVQHYGSVVPTRKPRRGVGLQENNGDPGAWNW